MIKNNYFLTFHLNYYDMLQDMLQGCERVRMRLDRMGLEYEIRNYSSYIIQVPYLDKLSS